MNKFLVGISAILLMGCDSLDSSYQIDKAPPVVVPPSKSTTCTVDFAKTCWAETIQKVTACLGSQSEGVFSFDRKFCTNDQKMLIDFANPAQMFESPYDMLNTPVDFRILSNSQTECFQVSGTRMSFEITLSQTGEKVLFENNGESLRFTCLDGQDVKVETKNFEGCYQKVGAGYAQTVPGLELEPFKEGGSTGWQMSFRGSAQPPIFRCRF